MFSTPYSLKKRTGKFDLERGAYLQQLVAEYTSDKTDEEKKEQVLANLGNFAYDPMNFNFLRRLNVHELFKGNYFHALKSSLRADCLSEKDARIKQFAVSGLCNLAVGSFKVLFISLMNRSRQS